MSEQDRGAYSPPRDEPLAFDARGARDARPMPMTLIASGVVLVVLIGGVVMAYLGGFRGKDEPAKAVGDRVATMKTMPAPGQAAVGDPAGKLEVFSSRTTASGPPAFTPGPEQPAERPRPQLQVQASTPPAVRIATGDEPATALPVAKPMTPAAVAAATAHPLKPGAKPTATVASATLPPAKPAAVKPAVTAPAALKPTLPATGALTVAAAKPAVAKPAAAVKPATTVAAAPAIAGGVGVQIGAFSSKELADQGFAAVGKLASTAGHGKRVEPVAHGASTLFRTTVTGFADRGAAKAFCETLTAKGHACIVKG